MTERRPRRKPGENRERLVKAGLIEFGLHGYHGASTSAIAARAGVPQPHLYASFDTKLALFLACAELAVEDAAGAPALTSRDQPSVAAPAVLVDPDERALFILQLVSAAASPDAPPRLTQLLSHLAEASGPTGLAPWLERSAAAVLRP